MQSDVESSSRAADASDRAVERGTGAAQRDRIDVGWVLDARLEEPDRAAAVAAMEAVEAAFARDFPRFRWRMVAARLEVAVERADEPVELLELGADEAARRGWDFALVVASADLRSRRAQVAFGVPSRPLGVAALSTFRLDPSARQQVTDPEARRATMARRLARLARASLGYLVACAPADDPGDAMHFPREEEALDGEATWSETQRRRLDAALARVADERVEEEQGDRERSATRFALRAAWRNRGQIARNLLENHSWEFPFRMGRLTTAAVSAVAILLVTAEAWELGGQLPVATTVVLPLLSILATALYVLQREHLLAPHRRRHRTEQTVVARTSVAAFVLMGMTITFVVLFLVALGLSLLIFRPELAARWAGRDPAQGVVWLYAAQALITSSLGILVGALGASFEGQDYVRYIAYVDDEL